MDNAKAGWALYALGCAVVLAIAAGLGTVVAVILKGTKLTADGTVSLDGTTPADPALLAGDAGLDLHTYALARMIESETGGLATSAKLGVAWATRNHADAVGQTVAALLLHATHPAANGYFGKQNQGRYASTSRDPTAASLNAAESVMAGLFLDPTGGADQWDSPGAYRDDTSSGETATDKASRVAQARLDAGKEMVLLDGVPESKIRFWRTA